MDQETIIPPEAAPAGLAPDAAAAAAAGHSMFDGCTETCGWIAAVITVIAWGSFGVSLRAIKSSSSSDGGGGEKDDFQAHPLVLQSYKTLTCFATCWGVVLLGEPIVWTSYGILSGMFWVPGAACGIYGIRNVGLAIAQGTWSSLNVLSGFIFGIIIFHERVRNIFQTMIAFTCLMIGLVGMSQFSSSSPPTAGAPPTTPSSLLSASTATSLLRSNSAVDDGRGGGSRASKLRSSVNRRSGGGGNSDNMQVPPPPPPASTTGLLPPASGSNMEPFEMEPLVVGGGDGGSPPPPAQRHVIRANSSDDIMRTTPAAAAGGAAESYDDEYLVMTGGGGGGGSDAALLEKGESNKRWIVCWGRRYLFTRQQLGLLGAIINGAWGGLNLIPMHYAMKANPGMTGARYLISYATGALIVNTLIWIGFFFYYLVFQTNKWNTAEALQSLPRPHVRQLFWPGTIAGLFYALGNFGSIISVAYLGQSIGFAVCQMQLFVSGLWGVFYFEEIRGVNVTRWFFSAALAVVGIIWLSYQHESSTEGGVHRNLLLM